MLEGLRILVLDDEAALRSQVSRRIHRVEPTWPVDGLNDPEEAIVQVLAGRFDAVLVDWNLKHALTGLHVCARIRAGGTAVGILMFTVSGGIANRIAALDVGADDYVVKSDVVWPDLCARIRVAVARRMPNRGEHGATGSTERIAVDLLTDRVFVEGIRVHMLPCTYKLLRYLWLHKRRLVPWSELEKKVFEAHLSEDTRHTKVSRLRASLGERACDAVVTADGCVGLFP